MRASSTPPYHCQLRGRRKTGITLSRNAHRKVAGALAVVIAASIGLCGASLAEAPPDDGVEPVPPGELEFQPIGDVAVIRPAGTPTSMAIFLSGDGGWNKGVVDMARTLAKTGTLVLGVNTPAYIKASDRIEKEECHSAAVDLQMLSQYAQRQFGFRQYMEPVLVGYSSGATLAYIALAQSPASFRGAVSLGFAPDLYNKKPYCHNVELLSHPDPDPKGGGHVIEPAAKLGKPWIVLQGLQDQDANPATARAFVQQVHDATFVELPKVGHGFSVFRNWGPQYEQAFRTVLGAAAADGAAAKAGSVPSQAGLDGLPIVTVVNPKAPATDYFAVFLSGDGGWADFDQSLARNFAARGVPAVGWSTLTYFWSKKTPEQSASDLSRVIEHFSRAWGRSRVVLVGYSYGADTLPFMVDGLPAEQKARVGVVVLISPGRDAQFEFSPLEWFHARQSGLPTTPAILKLDQGKAICIYGAKDHDSVCPSLPAGAATVVEMEGGHHLGGAYEKITRDVLGRLGLP